jgi:hypothetical protein
MIDHGKGPGGRLARACAFDRALSRDAPDLLGIHHVGGMGTAVAEIVPLHRQAIAGDGDAGQAVTGARVAAGKAVRSGKVDTPPGKPAAGGLDLGDAFDGKRGGLGPQGGILQRLW